MKNVVLFVILSFAGPTVNAQYRLSPIAKISIITCAPGQEETFTAFGHSAIRVYDSVNSIDFVYSYGVFDFNQQNFYINFTKGHLMFELGVYFFTDFLNAYSDEGRWVHEQALDLSPPQAQAVFNFLEVNARPENKVYHYDYFYNNCSSQIRDVFAEVLGDSLKFDGSYLKTNYTIRDLTDIYLTQQPWGDLGIDICLGLPMDKKASPYEYMFLPDYLESGFDHATIKTNGAWVPVVKSKIIHDAKTHPVVASPIHPWVAFGVIFLIIAAISAYDLKRKKLSKWLDVAIFSITGIFGLLLLLLWTATDHAAAAKNMNLLWALPPNLLVVLIYHEHSAEFLKKYFSIVTLVCAVIVLGWCFLPQHLNIFLLPFVAGLAVRGFTITRLL